MREREHSVGWNDLYPWKANTPKDVVASIQQLFQEIKHLSNIINTKCLIKLL